MEQIKIPLKNRVMSWLLSPGGYALWHSMGNPEEWEATGCGLRHKHAREYEMDMGYELDGIIPLMFRWLVICLIFDHKDPDMWFLRVTDRLLVTGRAERLRKRLLYISRDNRWRERNTRAFTKLTINEG